jgi:hypothetical protein
MQTAKGCTGASLNKDTNRTYSDVALEATEEMSCPSQVAVDAIAFRRRIGLGIHNRCLYIALVMALLLNVSVAVRRIPRDLIQPPQLLNSPSSMTTRSTAATAPPMMDVFEVSPVVKIPADVRKQCQQTLMVYSFGNSYGKPFVGE